MAKTMSKEMYGDICHNVNNKLAVAVGATTLIKNRKGDVDEKCLKLLEESLWEIRDYIRDIKEFKEEEEQ